MEKQIINPKPQAINILSTRNAAAKKVPRSKNNKQEELHKYTAT